jgi:ribosome-associated heat shock protein Hsp15
VSGTGGPAPVRLDKWLWAARFYRTRSLAAQAIEAGHVRVDGERVKPAQSIRAGTRASVRTQDLVWDFEVLQTPLRRGSAADAALLYRETPESAAARELATAKRRAARALPMPSGRPTKRDRRRLEEFLNEP